MRRLGSTLPCTIETSIVAIYLLWIPMGACSTTSPAPAPRTAPQASGSAGRRIAVEQEPPPQVASTAAPMAPRQVPDGCTTDIVPQAEAAPLMDQVAQSCLDDMSPVNPEPLLVSLKPGNIKEFPFTILDATKCIRAVATGAKQVRELELAVVDRADQVFGQDELPGAIALANVDGPICFKDPGLYRAVVRVVDGSGEVAVQVWQTR